MRQFASCLENSNYLKKATRIAFHVYIHSSALLAVQELHSIGWAGRGTECPLLWHTCAQIVTSKTRKFSALHFPNY